MELVLTTYARLQQIVDILAIADLEGLIRMGAPGDEYQSEAKAIADEITPQSSIEDIKDLIVDVLNESFDNDKRTIYPQDKLTEIAKKIKALYR